VKDIGEYVFYEPLMNQLGLWSGASLPLMADSLGARAMLRRVGS
jgi:hypothetical protein